MKKKYYWIISIIILIILGIFAFWKSQNKSEDEYIFAKPVQPTAVEIIETLDTFMQKQVEYNNFHGSVLIQKGDEVLLQKGYGMADYEQGIKNTEQTIFPIGSVTKQFIAFAIVQLIEEGKLDYYDTLDEYIGGFTKGNEITIKQLLTHTSGIKSFGQLDANLDKKIYDMSMDERSIDSIIQIIKQEELESFPGEEYGYNNSGYLILGKIVEIVSDKSLSEYLKESIFDPLGMKNTQPAFIDDMPMVTAKGYMGYLENVPVDDYDKELLSILYGAGYLSSTVSDLNIWAEAFENKNFVSQETVDAIFTSHVNTSTMGSDALYGYGYGWLISHNSNEVMHDGSTDSFNSVVAKYLYDDINIIILANKDYMGLDIHHLKDNLYNICLGKKVDMPEKAVEIKLSEVELSGFYGTYSNLDYEIAIKLENKNGNIIAEILPKELGIEPIKIYPSMNNRFFAKDVMMNITFNEAKDVAKVDVAGYHIDFRKE